MDYSKSSVFSPIFRRELKINFEIKSARLYCTSLGLYELYINGDKVGSDLFTHRWTSFEKRLQFQVSDISDMSWVEYMRKGADNFFSHHLRLNTGAVNWEPTIKEGFVTILPPNQLKVFTEENPLPDNALKGDDEIFKYLNIR